MTEEKNETCGIVMPISSIDGCGESHWSDVLEILTEAIEGAGFTANLVSNGDDSGIIQKRIIQNLYENPIVVCDVSGKNPNVMFELGMRLAFDKPTVIVKDDKTAYSFDTSPIEHVSYPRDLRFGSIVEFKEELKEKIEKTYHKSKDDPKYTTFLKHFGEFKVAKIESKEVSSDELILDEIRNIRRQIASMPLNEPSHPVRARTRTRKRPLRGPEFCVRNINEEEVNRIGEYLSEHPDVTIVRYMQRGPDHCHYETEIGDISSIDEIIAGMKAIAPDAKINTKGPTRR